MGKLLPTLIAVPAVGAAFYAAAITYLWFRQERLLFEPERLPRDEPICPDADVREFMVDVPGARLSVAQLKLPNPRGVVFYLHGNSGNLRKWFVGPRGLPRAQLRRGHDGLPRLRQEHRQHRQRGAAARRRARGLGRGGRRLRRQARW